MTTGVKQGLRCFFSIWSFLGITLLSVGSIYYLSWNGFIDHGEVNMTSISWLIYHGHPLYTALDAPERYSLEHGPLIYLLTGGLMQLLGANYFTAKISGVLPLLGTIVLSWYWFSQVVNKKIAFWLIGLETWLLIKWYYLYLNRPDTLMILCILVSIYVVTMKKNNVMTLIFVGISLGILLNLKVHGILYMIPILVLIQQNFGWKFLRSALCIIGFVGILPFLHPSISLIHYVLWLGAAVSHGMSFKIVVGNLLVVLLFCLVPIYLSIYYQQNFLKVYRDHRRFLTVTFVSLLLIALIGAKNGSGSHHLAPMLPIIMYINLILIKEIVKFNTDSSVKGQGFAYRSRYILIFLIVFIITMGGVNGTGKLINHIKEQKMPIGMVEEFNTIQNKYSTQTMMMGYGENKTYKRYNQLIPQLVFAGNPYFIDGCALMDMNYSGVGIPVGTIHELAEGSTQIWLIPVGDSPFSIPSWYNGTPIFDEKFRQTFFQNYVHIERGRYFDVWSYHK